MSQDNRARLKQWLESGEIRLQPLTFPQREYGKPRPYQGRLVPPTSLIIKYGLLNAARRERAAQGVDRQEVFRLRSFLARAALQMIGMLSSVRGSRTPG